MYKNYNSLRTGRDTWLKTDLGEVMGSPPRSNLASVLKSWHIVFLVFMSLTIGQNALAQSTANYAYSTNATGSLTLDMNSNAVDMSTGTNLLIGAGLDATASSVTSIGFDFYLMGTKFTNFSVQEDGILQLGNSTVPINTYDLTGGTAAAPRLSAFNADCRTGTSTGKIHYKLTGTAPNRVLVVEFLNMQLFYTSSAAAGTSTWQIRLYESGAIEYVYGTMSSTNIAVTDRKPTIGFYTGSASGKFVSILYATQTASTTTPYAVNPSVPLGAITNLTSAADGTRRTYQLIPPIGVPDDPATLTFSGVGAGAMQVNWVDNSTNESFYTITRATDAGFTQNVVTATVVSTTTAGTGTPYASTQTGLSPSTVYYYKIQSANESGGISAGATDSQSTNAPGNYVSAASGNWSDGATWVGGVAPSSVDNATIADGHTVTIDANGLGVYNLTIGEGTSGTVAYGSTPSAFTVIGNLTVNAGAAFNVFNGATGKSLTVGGNITNDGTMDLSKGTATTNILILNGTAVQTVGGAGSFTSNIIRNLTFNNTAAANPNINWNFNNLMVGGNLIFTAGRVALGTNKLTLGSGTATGTGTGAIGALTVTAGGFTSGKFNRYWGNTTAGTTVTAGSVPTAATSRYPFISAADQNRSAFIERTTALAAGQLSCTYADAATNSPVSVLDGAYTIESRYDGNWTFSVEGSAYSATKNEVFLNGSGGYVAANANSHILLAASAAGGTHQGGTNTPGGERAFSVAELTAGALYIGAANADIVQPCAGTPAPGNTIAASASVCSGATDVLSLQNATTGTGVTYQWQSGPAADGPWTNIDGATNATYTATVTADTWYQNNVTCSGNTTTSNPVNVTLSPFYNCAYAIVSATSNADEDIFNVTVGTLNNSSTCTGTAPGPGSIKGRYGNFRTTVAPPDLQRTSVVNFSLTQGTCGDTYGNGFQIYIDYNQNGIYENSERVFNQPAAMATSPNVQAGNFTVPLEAALGTTGMRVVLEEGDFPDATNYASTSYNWGETEDYLVTITAAPSCLIPTNLAVSNVTFTTADLHWTAPAFVPDSGYEWAVSTSATPPASGTAEAGTSVSISDLTPETVYYLHVRSICSPDTDVSAWSTTSFYTGYCQSTTTPVNTSAAFISSFQTTGGFSNILNNTTYSADGYNNFTGLAVSNTAGSPISFTLAQNLVDYYYGMSIWVDWNNDFDFDDAGEKLYSAPIENYANTLTGTITIPPGTPLGNYRMRVRVDYITYEELISACGNTAIGETEDYTLSVVDTPTCFAPTALAASDLTTTSANLSWTAPVPAPGVGYEWAVTTSNIPPDSGTPEAGTSVSTLSLSENTTYFLHVRSECTAGTDYSAWATITFKTLCNAANVPYTENFNSAVTPGMPNCTSLENAGFGNNWATDGVSGLDYGFTTNALTYTYNSASPANTWFYTAGINLTAGTSYRIGYRYGTAGLEENLQVKYGTSPNSASMTIPIADYSGIDDDSPTTAAIDFIPSSSGVYYFGFNAYSDADEYLLFVDDISIVVSPPIITSFTPTAICAGAETTVVITGSGFTGATAVTLNNTDATSFTVDSATQISAVFPVGATTGKIRVTNAFGTGASATNVTVTAYPTVAAIAGDSDVCAGQTLSLSESTTGGVWSSSDVDVATVNTSGVVTAVAAGTVTISYTKTSSGCATVQTHDVTVNAAVAIVSSTSSQTVVTGDDTAFSVEATGTGLAYTWQVDTGSGFADITSGDIYTDYDTSTLVLTAVPVDYNNYQYRCIVSGAGSCASATTTAALLLVGDTGIASQPNNVSLCDSGNPTFTVIGSGDIVSYSWEEDQGGNNWVALADGGIYSGTATAMLSLTGVTTANNGWRYRCVITGNANSATSNPAVLTVNQSVVITTDPGDQTVCYTGATFNFTSAATGTITGYQWKYSTDGIHWDNVSNGTPAGVTYSGTTSNTLAVTTTPSTPATGDKFYEVVVKAGASCTDATSSMASLSIDNPVITSQPGAASVFAGNSTTFTVATSDPAPVYQWQRSTTLNGTYANVTDGTPTGVTYSGNTTATLTVAATYAATAGTGNFYRAVINPAGCSKASTGAQLTLNNYCKPTDTNGGTTDIITKVVLTNVSTGTNVTQTSTGASPYYTAYTNTPLDIVQGSDMTAAITFGSDGTQYSAVWVDYNNNGTFEAPENVALATASAGGNATVTYSFTIPVDAATGLTRIRLRGGSDNAYTAGGACSSTGYGETEDYSLNIIAAPSCSGTPTAATVPATFKICDSATTGVAITATDIPALSGLTLQWEESDDNGVGDAWANAVGGSGATTASYTTPVLSANRYYRLKITCTGSGEFAYSEVSTVSVVSCSFNTSLSSDVTYTSIMPANGGSGTAFPGWQGEDSSGDDNISTTVSLAGTTFSYQGQPVSGFQACTNGWMTFNTANTSYTWDNDLTAASSDENDNFTNSATNRILSPFWDDLVVTGGSYANINSSMRYEVSGVLGSGSAVITVEWAGMERYSISGPNLNFQVKLYESDNHIEYVYGNFEGFDGSFDDAYSYSIGYNGTLPSGTTATNRFAMQTANANHFSAATDPADLIIMPSCNSMVTLTPGVYSGLTSAPAVTAPANDEAAGAIVLTAADAPQTAYCGTYYTSKGATSSGVGQACGTVSGADDDDVWFKFDTTVATDYTIKLRNSPDYDGVLQLLDASLTPITCANVTGEGMTETINATGLTAGGTTYYIRVFHNGATIGDSGGEFSISINEVISPPANDNIGGAVALTVSGNSTCSAISSPLPNALVATASPQDVCGGTPDDDLWYQFTATAGNNLLTVQSGAGYNAYVEVFSSSDNTPTGSLTSMACINDTSTAGAETYSGPFVIGKTYFVRVYHFSSGAGSGAFSICVTSACSTPISVNVEDVTTTTATISWTAVGSPSNGYEYEIRTSGAAGSGATGLITSGSTEAGIVTADVSGLTASSSYKLYVRSSCGDGDFSEWTGATVFNSACNAENVPYTMNFETAAVPALPLCTTNVNAGSGNNWVTASSPGNGFTSNTLEYAWNDDNDANTWFFTNGVNLTANTAYRITYRYGNNSASDFVESLKVAYGNSADPDSMTSDLADYPSIDDGTAHTASIDFVPSSSGVYYFGFNAYSAADQFELFLDDIHVDVTPSCSITTTWNGSSWSPFEPLADQHAVINGDYSEAVDLAACSLDVTGTAVVSVPSGYDFHIDGAVTVAATASLTFQNNANLIQVQNVANTGNITSNREASMRRLDYVYWGSPVAGQNLKSFSPETVSPPVGASRFYTLNEATNLFEVIEDPTVVNFALAKGYMLRAPNNFGTSPEIFAGKYTGVPNNGDATIAIADSGLGYNMIGNPYPSPVSASLFLASNPGALYFWTHFSQNAASGANYATYSDMGYAASAGGETIPNGTIQTGQGFLLKTETPGTATFTNAMRVGNNDGQFFRNAGLEKHRIWLNLSNPEGPQNQILIGYMDGATEGFDLSIDAKQIETGISSISSIINNENYNIQGRSLPFGDTDVVPLNFKAVAAGTFTISIDHLDGLFAGDQDVFIKDNLTGVVHNIKESGYTFASAEGTFAERFDVIFQNTVLGTGTPAFDANSIIVYKQNNILNINSGNVTMSTVRIFDIRGRLIYEKDGINANTTSLNDLRAEQEVLLVQITSDDNRIVTKKVVY